MSSRTPSLSSALAPLRGRWKSHVFPLALLATGLAGVGVGAAPAQAQAATEAPAVVINEVHTAGTAVEPVPFLELFNASNVPVDLQGWELTVIADDGDPQTWTLIDAPVPLSGTIQPYSHFLIEGRAGLGGRPIPTPDLVAPDLILRREMSNAIYLSEPPATERPWLDAVGFGAKPVHWEGAEAGSGHPTSHTRVSRRDCGTDTDDNGADFVDGGEPTPENSAAPSLACAPPCRGEAITMLGRGTITGTAGDDVILASDQDDVIDGGGGADTICALGGSDVVTGGEGSDVVYGGLGVDEVAGGTGADTLIGGPANDLLTGGADGDTAYGGSGTDALGGDEGDDVLAGGDDGDFLSGGDGSDVVHGNAGADEVGGNGDGDRLTGGPGADNVHGGAGADRLLGASGRDVLQGEGGNDSLYGGEDDDDLRGGDDDDFLHGGPGSDTLDGGAGSNVLRP